MGEVIELTRDSLESKDSHNSAPNGKPTKVLSGIQTIQGRFDLWHSKGAGYITTSNGHFAIRDSRLKQYIQHYLYRKEGNHYTSNQLTEVLEMLETIAIHECEEHVTANRFFKDSEAMYIYIGSDNGVLRISPDQVSYIHNDVPCRFLTSKNQQSWTIDISNPLPWDDIYKLFSIENQGYRSIIRAFMLGCMNPDIHYPLLQIVGKAGSGKSSLAEFIKQTVDPSRVTIKQAPGKEDDVMASIANEHVTAFDNLDSLTKTQQDMLCRVSTGSTYSKRQLFSDNESFDVIIRKPLILTALYPVVTSNDLIDRSILFKKYNPKELVAEEHLDKRFEHLAPRIRGRLILDIQQLLKSEDTHTSKLGRMAGFEQFVSGLPELKDVIKHSKSIRKQQLIEKIHEDDLYFHIYDQLLDKGYADITTSTVKSNVDEISHLSAKKTAQKIKESAALFNELGVETDFSERDSLTRRRKFLFYYKDGVLPSEASEPSEPKSYI